MSKSEFDKGAEALADSIIVGLEKLTSDHPETNKYYEQLGQIVRARVVHSLSIVSFESHRELVDNMEMVTKLNDMTDQCDVLTAKSKTDSKLIAKSNAKITRLTNIILKIKAMSDEIEWIT